MNTSLEELRQRCTKKLDELERNVHEMELTGTYDLISNLKNIIFSEEDFLKHANDINFNYYEQLESKINELCDLSNMLIKASSIDLNKQKEKCDKTQQKFEKSADKYEKRDISYNGIDFRSFLSLLLTTAVVTIPYGGYKWSKYSYGNQAKGPNVIVEEVDSFGNISSNSSHIIKKYINENDFLTVYSPTDGSGIRSKSIYSIPVDVDYDKIDLIDLENLTFISKEIINDKDSNNVSTDEYRVLTNFIVDEEDVAKVENKENADFVGAIISVVLISLLTLFLEAIAGFISIDDDFDFPGSEIVYLIEDIIQLINNAILLLDKSAKNIKNNKEEKKYNKIKNILNNRLYDLLNKYTLLYSNLDVSKKDNANFDAVVSNAEKTLSFYKKEMNALAKKMDMSGDYNLHNLKLTPEVLFDYLDDHKRIKPIWLDKLAFIDFTYYGAYNMEATNIDFRNTNFVINPSEVLNGDVSGSKFNESNLILEDGYSYDPQTHEVIKNKGLVLEMK